MSESIKRIMSLTLPKSYPEDIDLVRLINYRMFVSCINNDIRCSIMSLIAKGITSALDVSKILGLSRTAIYRHLNALRRNGLLIYRDGNYFVAARIFLVYDVSVDSEGLIRITVYPDKGGFIDEDLGFVLVKGELCRCEVCRVFEHCLKAVKNLARRLDVKIRSEKPIEAFIEIAREVTYRDVFNIMKNGYLVVKTAEDIAKIKEEGELEDEKTRVQA